MNELISNLERLCSANGIDAASWLGLWQKNAVANRFDPKEVIFFKRMLQRELPYELRHTITSQLFEQYVGATERDFSKQLYMSLDEVRTLTAAGMYVGSHTYDHFWLNALSAEAQETEIDRSLDFLSRVGAATEDWVMCYPYGAYNETTLKILGQKRCAIGLTTRVGMADLQRDEPLELSRLDTNDFPQ